MISKHPINLALRFLLELAAIFAFGTWGYFQASGGLGILLAVIFPLMFAIHYILSYGRIAWLLKQK